MKIIINNIKSNKGLTLIETVVSFAIIAVIAVVIVMGFNTMGNVLQEGSKVSRLDQELEKKIAMGKESTVKSDATLIIDSDDIQIKGTIKEFTVTEDGKTNTFRVFVAD